MKGLTLRSLRYLLILRHKPPFWSGRDRVSFVLLHISTSLSFNGGMVIIYAKPDHCCSLSFNMPREVELAIFILMMVKICTSCEACWSILQHVKLFSLLYYHAC